MARNTDDYGFWRAALRGEKQAVQESNPQCGFYRRRVAKDGPWLPLAIWKTHLNEMACAFKGKKVDPIENWTYAAKNPVTEEAYRFHIANGHWPDEAAEAPRSNMPSDPFEALKAEIEDKLEQAEGFLSRAPKASTETDASMARNIQAQLLGLNKRADALHKEEKQPHLDASRAVDARFEFRKTVADIAVRLRAVFEAFMRVEEARQRAEAQKKFEEERKRTEEARRAAEEERRRLEREDPIMAAVTPAEVVPEPVFAPDPIKINVGGGFGRKAGLKSVYEPVIKDYRAALAHFAEHDDVRAVIEKLVKADLRFHKTKSTVPGVDVVQQRVAA